MRLASFLFSALVGAAGVDIRDAGYDTIAFSIAWHTHRLGERDTFPWPTLVSRT